MKPTVDSTGKILELSLQVRPLRGLPAPLVGTPRQCTKRVKEHIETGVPNRLLNRDERNISRDISFVIRERHCYICCQAEGLSECINSLYDSCVKKVLGAVR